MTSGTRVKTTRPCLVSSYKTASGASQFSQALAQATNNNIYSIDSTLDSSFYAPGFSETSAETSDSLYIDSIKRSLVHNLSTFFVVVRVCV